ncbi:MAG: hypothetical protein K9W44_09470 [Candidatus Lokiarchaeota archaeon]|nr:hypothetical protein [Candidatus Harpocratesius repetitus]
MIWELNGENFETLELNHFVIYDNQQKTKILNILKALKLPGIIINNIYLLNIPDNQKDLFLNHYEIIQEENPYLINPFSFDDFILAYIAAEFNWSVISYDHHLLRTIHDYLEFEAFYPSEIDQMPADSVFLIDSNILLTYSKKKKKLKQEIIVMFQNNPSMTFLIPETILMETYRVHKSLSFSTRFNPLIYMETEEQHLSQYIDNFEGFISNHAQRIRKKKFQKKIDSRNHRDPLHGKWGKYI